MFESVDGTLADALRGRIRRNQFRMLLLDITQFAQELVVRLIADRGLVLDVIEVIVPPNLVAQRFDPLRDGPPRASLAHRKLSVPAGPRVW